MQISPVRRVDIWVNGDGGMFAGVHRIDDRNLEFDVPLPPRPSPDAPACARMDDVVPVAMERVSVEVQCGPALECCTGAVPTARRSANDRQHREVAAFGGAPVSRLFRATLGTTATSAGGDAGRATAAVLVHAARSTGTLRTTPGNTAIAIARLTRRTR
jgi:hypothetical protein